MTKKITHDMPRFYILIATTMLLVSCARKEADHTNASSSEVDPTSTIQHAQNFSVTNFKTYKIVKTHASITRWGSDETQT
ncbi:MAG: hypothetical protein ACKPHV_06670, partial [Microcystis panniformis]